MSGKNSADVAQKRAGMILCERYKPSGFAELSRRGPSVINEHRVYASSDLEQTVLASRGRRPALQPPFAIRYVSSVSSNNTGRSRYNTDRI